VAVESFRNKPYTVRAHSSLTEDTSWRSLAGIRPRCSTRSMMASTSTS